MYSLGLLNCDLPRENVRFQTAFRSPVVCQPFRKICICLNGFSHPFDRNIHPFDQLDHPFVENISSFERLCHPFSETSARSTGLVIHSSKTSIRSTSLVTRSSKISARSSKTSARSNDLDYFPSNDLHHPFGRFRISVSTKTRNDLKPPKTT